MKTIIKFICTAAFIYVALSCCKKDDVPGYTPEQTDFMTENVCGVYSVKDGKLFVYSEATCQLYYSPTRYSARILQDDLQKYITVTFVSEIAADTTVKGSVSLEGFSAGSYKDYDLRILKMEDSKAWVWYDRGNVGYIIPWGI